MARGCRFGFGDRSGSAGWSFDGSYLAVTPDAGAPLSFAVHELAGISGDGHTLVLTVTGGMLDAAIAPGAADPIAMPARRAELILTHLGADGPTLLEELRRTWIGARAKVLRLGGSGEGKPFTGRVTGLQAGSAESGAVAAPVVPAAPSGLAAGPGTLPEPFQALLFEDVLVVAREARDLDPLFVALLGSVAYDDATYSVRVRQWPGQEVVFSKLAGQTEEFLKRLQACRALLSREAAATLAAAAPTLPSGPRGTLAGMWLPGRLMEIEALEAVCPGFAELFRRAWLGRLARAEEGEHLMHWASSGTAWLGCTRGPDGGGAAESAEAESGSSAEAPLWLLCGKHGVWFLESLSLGDRATYCFHGGEEVPALVSRLLCAPEFSRQALYSPLSELTGDNAPLAIPAQYLGFLADLRARFRDRVIHQTLESWKRDIATLGKSAPT